MLTNNQKQKLFDQFDKDGDASVQSHLDQYTDIDRNKDLARREWLYSLRLKREEM